MCQAGHFSSEGADFCTKCSAGSYTAAAAAGECLACDAGYFSGSSGATTCRNCTAQPGNFCPLRSEAAAGEPCPAGFRCAGGHHDKVPCPAGTFKEAQGAGNCSQCLAGTFSAVEVPDPLIERAHWKKTGPLFSPA